MNKFQAMHQFFSSFGLRAYEENSVPENELAPAFPYITYDASTTYGDEEIQIMFSLWYRDTGMAAIDQKVLEIAEDIGFGKVIAFDEGAVVIRPGDSFAQSMSDDSDPLVKRKVITLYVRFVTTH